MSLSTFFFSSRWAVPWWILIITFEIWIFFLQNRMDSLQEAFIHPPEQNTETPAHCNDKAWKSQDNF